MKLMCSSWLGEMDLLTTLLYSAVAASEYADSIGGGVEEDPIEEFESSRLIMWCSMLMNRCHCAFYRRNYY